MAPTMLELNGVPLSNAVQREGGSPKLLIWSKAPAGSRWATALQQLWDVQWHRLWAVWWYQLRMWLPVLRMPVLWMPVLWMPVPWLLLVLCAA